MKRVAVVGGGYAGVQIARRLDPHAEVVLMDRKETFIHNVAAIRAVVDPRWLDKVVMPYTGLLRRGKVIQGSAVNITDTGVSLAGGEFIEADAVVVATGSSYASPFKTSAASAADFVEESKAVHASLGDARALLIVGGGPVGVELAGEVASAFPGKEVELVSSGSALLDGMPAGLQRRIAEQLATLKVRVRLGERMTDLRSTAVPYLDDDRLVVPALGARPVAPPMAHLKLASNGRVGVDSWLRPEGFRNVFVLGDAANTGDPMTIIGLSRQVRWLAKVINALLNGGELAKMRPYKPSSTPGLLVPLGPEYGAGVLPMTRNGWLIGAGLTARIKGRDLFASKYHRTLGVSYPSSST